MDLTGCPTVSLSFKESSVRSMIDSGKLWELIKHFDEEGYLLSGGTPGEDLWTEGGFRPDVGNSRGLIAGHAYSVITAKEIKGNRLLNLRNPWGDFEWNGDWSDKSPLWT